MKPKSEEICKSVFDRYLRMFHAPEEIVWRCGDEPPDYYLEIMGTEFAVEVTTLMEKISIGSDEMPEATIENSLHDLIKEVELTASNEGFLSGTYLVNFSNFSMPFVGFGAIRKALKSALLEYVCKFQFVENADKVLVLKQDHSQCTIRKLHNLSNKIGISIRVTNLKWEREVELQVCDLLEAALAKKRQKLKMVHFSKILLLLDAYHFASHTMYKNCLGRLESLNDFHTVFLVQSGEDGFLLYTENKNWIFLNKP